MASNSVKTVAVVTSHDQRHLSKAQKAFNVLIKQIESQRVRLGAWEAAIPRYHQKYSSELVPLVEGSVDLQVELVHCLDRASAQKGLSKTERRMISSLITELAGELVACHNDAELKAIYNRHSESDYDSEEAAHMNGLKSMLEDTLGFELGDDIDICSPEDMFMRAEARMREERAQYDTDRQAHEERRSKRKKSAKQLAREVQQQAEAQQINQSIREVYRKLASALHPDREPDPQERERKTALMQRANLAYEKNNLLQLLELQLELEHIDQTAINNIGEDRLKHYNKILKEQLAELSQEIWHVEGRFRVQFDVDPYENLSPATLMRRLAREIIGVQQSIRDLKKDLRVFEDIKKLKAWLKEIRQSAKNDCHDFDGCPF
jgi:RNA polymerase-interacting CarD/CdnL/TRCF family regulator